MKKSRSPKDLGVSASLREPEKEASKPSLVPKLRFPKFRGSGEWSEVRLGDAADIKTGPFGSTLHQSDYVVIYPIRPADDRLLRSYLFYLLLSQDFFDYAIRNSERGKIPKINRDALVTYAVLIPSPAEQQRIADCLTSLDALITAETQKLAALKTHKRGLMQQLFPSEKLEGGSEK